MTRQAQDANGNGITTFAKGGKTLRLEIGPEWTEFDPDGVKLFRLHVPVVPAGRVIYTCSTDFPDIEEGDEVSADHLMYAITYQAGVWPDCWERSPDGPRFFFALADAGDDTTALLFEGAAS